MRRRLTAILLTVSLLFSFAIILASADSAPLGDVTNDGKITASDARKTLRASAKLETLTDVEIITADVDFNGKVTAADARKILRVSAKLDEFDVPETTTQETTTAEEATTKAEETTTTAEETTTNADSDLPEADTGVVVDEYPAAIDAFFSGKFYLNGTMVDGGNTMPLKMATGNSQTEIAMTIPNSNLQVSIYAKGKDTFLKLASGTKKHYVPLSDVFKDEMGVDFSEIMGQLTSIKFNDAGKPVLTKGTYEGMECDIYTFSNEEGTSIKFFAIEDRIVQITLADANSVASNIAITELTGKIPSNMLTTKGYTKTSIAFIPVLYPEFSGNI
ncbi:MAG: dockerin type I repeat-containing protein [Clostridia bacterium]|nr:dockerin type I repeat-containing protein [Clostridia bacterium]